MNRPISANGKLWSADQRGPADIGFSLTNERGEHFRCRAKGVTLRIRRGVAQLVEGPHGCFVWFDRCRVELHDGHRRLCYRLRAGSASRDGDGLTILAEVVGNIAGTVREEREPGHSRRRLASASAPKATSPRDTARNGSGDGRKFLAE